MNGKMEKCTRDHIIYESLLKVNQLFFSTIQWNRVVQLKKAKQKKKLIKMVSAFCEQ